MPQRTLHAYFGFPARHPPSINGLSFLDLTYEIRHRVYVLAGLVRICPIDLNQEGEGKANADEIKPVPEDQHSRCYYPYIGHPGVSYSWYENNIDCVCAPLPISLLYVSRAISKECSHILYSENKFKICRSRHGGFLPLHSMAGTTLDSITSLSIRLNACSCCPRHKCKDQRHGDYHLTCKGGCYGRDKPLGKISRNDKSVISDWKRVCARISSNIKPFHLKLFVICDAASYEVAAEVVQPLLKMPTLQGCSIRLGQIPNHELHRLAQRTVYHVTGKSASTLKRRHCNTQLPIEIQEEILGYTDLIAPHVLEWEPDHGLTVSDCCKKCTDALEACCCSLQHAAFAVACACWKIPTDLFLLSRSLREGATRIFYQRNHFAILPPGANFTFLDAQPPLLDFFKSLPQQALRNLRSLECILPTLSSDFLIPGSDANSHWLQTLTFISNNLQISTLSLTLNMSSDRGPSSDCAYMSLQEILEREDAMWETYQRIVEPLTITPLNRGLKDLFIHLSWPTDDAKRHIRNAQERILEQKVMGEGYDAILQGKFATWRRWDNEIH